LRPETDQNMVPPMWASTVGVNMVLLCATATYKHVGKRPRRPQVGRRRDRVEVCSLSHVPPVFGSLAMGRLVAGRFVFGAVLVAPQGLLNQSHGSIPGASFWPECGPSFGDQIWYPFLGPLSGLLIDLY